MFGKATTQKHCSRRSKISLSVPKEANQTGEKIGEKVNEEALALDVKAEVEKQSSEKELNNYKPVRAAMRRRQRKGVISGTRSLCKSVNIY